MLSNIIYGICHTGQTYLIFVISFTQSGFLNPNILHLKIMKNTPKFVFCAFLLDKFTPGQIIFTQVCGACTKYEVCVQTVPLFPAVKKHKILWNTFQFDCNSFQVAWSAILFLVLKRELKAMQRMYHVSSTYNEWWMEVATMMMLILLQIGNDDHYRPHHHP